MKSTTYFQWIKDISYYGVSPEILKAVTQISAAPQAISFKKYPPELMPVVNQLQQIITGLGIDPADPSVALTTQTAGTDTITIAKVPLKNYGTSTLSFIAVNQELVGKVYDIKGDDFVLLTISVQHWEQVYLTGNTITLGNWDAFNGIPLVFAGGRGGPFWEIQVPMLPGETIEFKFLTPDHNITGLLVYEAGNNRTFTAGNDDGFYSAQV